MLNQRQTSSEGNNPPTTSSTSQFIRWSANKLVVYSNCCLFTFAYFHIWPLFKFAVYSNWLIIQTCCLFKFGTNLNFVVYSNLRLIRIWWLFKFVVHSNLLFIQICFLLFTMVVYSNLCFLLQVSAQPASFSQFAWLFPNSRIMPGVGYVLS